MSETVQLEAGVVVCKPGDTVRHVYFPNDCRISLMTGRKGGQGVEVGMVGREGMLGTQLVLGVDTVRLRGVVQGAGSARRVDASSFCRELSRSKPLKRILDRYLYVLMSQLASSAACTRFHRVGPRLARWLLMSQDRAHSDRFHLTHESIADMLGVRRVGITGAASAFQRLGLIKYNRGEIIVLDRSGLKEAACDCYASDQRDYGLLLA